MFWPGGSFFVWVGGMNGGRDERTDCQRDGCMVGPGAVASPAVLVVHGGRVAGW